jgi:hypothetical protein
MYRSWEGRTLALAGSKGFLLALTKDSTGKSLTVEEYKYGEVEVPGMAMTGRSGKTNGIVIEAKMRAGQRQKLFRHNNRLART